MTAAPDAPVSVTAVACWTVKGSWWRLLRASRGDGFVLLCSAQSFLDLSTISLGEGETVDLRPAESSQVNQWATVSSVPDLKRLLSEYLGPEGEQHG